MKLKLDLSPKVVGTALVVVLLAAGCSGSSGKNENTAGGTASIGGAGPGVTGGVAATGGGLTTVSNPTSSGGTTPSGGAAGLGGKSQVGSVVTTGGVAAAGGKVATGGNVATGGATTVAGGNAATGGATAAGGAVVTKQCSTALPTGAGLVDTTTATVIGTGSADTCKFSDLGTAVAKGGTIKFNCGSAPYTIPITATLNLPTNKDTVIDGGDTITLDGQSTTQILRFQHDDFMVNNSRVTLQRLKLINGKATPTEQIPTATAPCSQGWDDGEGGALFMRDGNLTVINCTFSNNQAAQLGPDTGGGAIYINASKNGALIVNSVFTNNSASNAGAVGGLFAELDIYNSRFDHDTATGNGANSDDASQCNVINNNQHEVGSGGNGGAIYQDGGDSTNIVLCGIEVTNNAAGTGAFGGGVFMTSNDWSGTLTIRDSTITGNTGKSWTVAQEGSVTDVGSAFGVNAKSIAVSNSTLQQ